MCVPEKAVINLTKGAFANVCAHIQANYPDSADMCITVLTNALKETTGFSAQAKKPREVCERQYALERERVAREGTTFYEKYTKKKYETRKEKYPGVPTMMLSKPECEIKQWIAENTL